MGIQPDLILLTNSKSNYYGRMLSAGGYAEQVLTHERMLMPIPPNLTFEQAAAIPEVFFTAYDALIDKADFQAGDTVLIHAGASGVGTANVAVVCRWEAETIN